MEMSHLHNGNIALVPLFHGTSELFLSSILSVGLGKKNPNSELDTLELMEALVQLAPDMMEDLDCEESLALQAILRGVRRDGEHYYRYNGVYLSPSMLSAARYAINNRFGSELLSTALNCFAKLRSIDRARADEIAERFPSATRLIDLAYKPVLIEVIDIPIAQLATETGGDPMTNFEDMRDFANLQGAGIQGARSNNAFWQQCNFELSGSISRDQLRCSWINLENEDDPMYYVFPEFTLELI